MTKTQKRIVYFFPPKNSKSGIAPILDGKINNQSRLFLFKIFFWLFENKDQNIQSKAEEFFLFFGDKKKFQASLIKQKLNFSVKSNVHKLDLLFCSTSSNEFIQMFLALSFFHSTSKKNLWNIYENGSNWKSSFLSFILFDKKMSKSFYIIGSVS